MASSDPTVARSPTIQRPPELPRSIGVWGGAGIMVGIIIGSGIFRTPASIAKVMNSPALILVLWAVGGIISLFGALAYAELGTMYPKAGGVYVFLQRGFGNLVAFVFGWTFLLITKPMAIAAIATVFSEHVLRLFSVDCAWAVQLVTCCLIVFLTYINTRGMKLGADLAVVLTGLKMAALAGIVVLAVILMKGDSANFQAGEAPPNTTFLGALIAVVAAVMWTYDGWSDGASVAEEVREPQKKLPAMFIVGTASTVAIYLAVNAVYIWLVPLSEMRDPAMTTVAPVVMRRLIGGAGDLVVTLVIIVSTFGAVHASIITGARVTFAQARDGLLFSSLAGIHPVHQTPAPALWIQGVLACVMCLGLKHFEKLIGGFVFTSWIFYGLAGAAVMVLRWRRPGVDRPYRCWGYPVVPVLFVLSSAAMTVLSIRESPTDTLPWLGGLLAGAPAYWLWRRFSPPPVPVA